MNSFFLGAIIFFVVGNVFIAALCAAAARGDRRYH